MIEFIGVWRFIFELSKTNRKMQELKCISDFINRVKKIKIKWFNPLDYDSFVCINKDYLDSDDIQKINEIISNNHGCKVDLVKTLSNYKDAVDNIEELMFGFVYDNRQETLVDDIYKLREHLINRQSELDDCIDNLNEVFDKLNIC